MGFIVSESFANIQTIKLDTTISVKLHLQPDRKKIICKNVTTAALCALKMHLITKHLVNSAALSLLPFSPRISISEDVKSHKVSLVKSLAGVFGVVDEQLAGSELVTINLLKTLHFLHQLVGSK